MVYTQAKGPPLTVVCAGHRPGVSARPDGARRWQWIGRHHRQRRKLLAQTGFAATVGLVALGFTSVYREGFEVVLFLQSLQLREGSGVVLEGLVLGLAGTAAVGVVTFWLHHRLPYKRMLVLTGVLVGVVLVVMIGGTALSFQDLGWLPRHETPFTLPGWMGAWFEMYSSWETLGIQVLAACSWSAPTSSPRSSRSSARSAPASSRRSAPKRRRARSPRASTREVGGGLRRAPRPVSS